MKHLDIARALLLYVPFIVVMVFAPQRVWRSQASNVRLSQDALVEQTPFIRVTRRYVAPIPSAVAAICLFLPASIVSHYSEVERNHSMRVFANILQRPLWNGANGFFLCALSIEVFGFPMRMVPLAKRSGKSLE